MNYHPPLQTRPRVKRLTIYNYRSIGEDGVNIQFPHNAPLVLIGENNAGKSNILRALSLILGETWAGNYMPEDHECFGRSPEGLTIWIRVEVAGVFCPYGCGTTVDSITLKYAKGDSRPCEYTIRTSGCAHTWMSNELKSQIACMLIGTERDLTYQLSYNSKWTYLSKLMRRFHSQLTDDESRVQKLKQFYSGLVETFYEVPEFSKFAESLKESSSRFGGNLPYGLDIDFSAYDASNFFRSLRLFPHIDGEARSFEELGTGQAQILAIAFSHAYAQAFGSSGLILAIEEPEAHLHPLAQAWVSQKLMELTQSGTQVILTTHSPSFIDLSSPETLVVVRKEAEGQATQITQLTPSGLVQKLVSTGVPVERVDNLNVGPFYESSSTNDIKEGMFARACVLVEGATERFGLPELLKRVGTDLARLGVALLPVEGISNIAKWHRFFEAHGYRVYPIFDSDSDKGGSKQREAERARKDIFLALGLSSENDWNDYTQGPVGIHDRFTIFDANYESALGQLFGPHYSGLEDEAKRRFGPSKSLAARYVAQHLPSAEEDPSTDDGWTHIKRIAGQIEQFVSTPLGSEIVLTNQ